MYRALTIVVTGTMVALGTAPAWAQINHTALEIAMLPDYCQARLIGDEQARKPWRQRMGQDFIHLHHYCSGLTAMRRASNAIDASKRKDYLGFAVQEFDYVIKQWTPNFYLMKDAQQQRALALVMLGRRPQFNSLAPKSN